MHHLIEKERKKESTVSSDFTNAFLQIRHVLYSTKRHLRLGRLQRAARWQMDDHNAVLYWETHNPLVLS